MSIEKHPVPRKGSLQNQQLHLSEIDGVTLALQGNGSIVQHFVTLIHINEPGKGSVTLVELRLVVL